jgi:hypothetical protein
MDRRQLLVALFGLAVPATVKASPEKRLVLDYTSTSPYLRRALPYWPGASQNDSLLAKECWLLPNGDLEIWSYQVLKDQPGKPAITVVMDQNGPVLKRTVARAGAWMIERLNSMGVTIGVETK